LALALAFIRALSPMAIYESTWPANKGRLGHESLMAWTGLTWRRHQGADDEGWHDGGGGPRLLQKEADQGSFIEPMKDAVADGGAFVRLHQGKEP
jgi:hypothetical protein